MERELARQREAYQKYRNPVFANRAALVAELLAVRRAEIAAKNPTPLTDTVSTLTEADRAALAQSQETARKVKYNERAAGDALGIDALHRQWVHDPAG